MTEIDKALLNADSIKNSEHLEEGEILNTIKRFAKGAFSGNGTANGTAQNAQQQNAQQQQAAQPQEQQAPAEDPKESLKSVITDLMNGDNLEKIAEYEILTDGGKNKSALTNKDTILQFKQLWSKNKNDVLKNGIPDTDKTPQYGDGSQQGTDTEYTGGVESAPDSDQEALSLANILCQLSHEREFTNPIKAIKTGVQNASQKRQAGKEAKANTKELAKETSDKDSADAIQKFCQNHLPGIGAVLSGKFDQESLKTLSQEVADIVKVCKLDTSISDEVNGYVKAIQTQAQTQPQQAQASENKMAPLTQAFNANPSVKQVIDNIVKENNGEENQQAEAKVAPTTEAK